MSSLTDIAALQAAVYFNPDPTTSPHYARLHELETLHIEEFRPKVLGEKQRTTNDKAPIFLGKNTTGIEVEEIRINIDPIPVGLLNLLDPQSEPLLTVRVKNCDGQVRRVGVEVLLEGLSCRCSFSKEIDPLDSYSFKLSPVLFPERIREATESRRAALHIRVIDLDGKVETEQTLSVTCLANTIGRNGYFDGDGNWRDLKAYYGAWVTPNADAVLRLLRSASDKHPDKRFAGYTSHSATEEQVRDQVAAMFAAVKSHGITYINSITVTGPEGVYVTQRCRLPRESIVQQAANCLDGTVLYASLMEAASLQPALVCLPGHALVAWKKHGKEETTEDELPNLDEWEFLETTMTATHSFDDAVASARRQIQDRATPERWSRVRFHRLRTLRSRGIYPME